MALSKIKTNSLSDDAVTAAKIATGTIVAADLAADSVDSSELVDGGVDLSHMSVNSIDSDQYVDGSIDTAHIANLQITTALIAADAVDGTKLADNAVDSEHYTDGSIDNAHIADDAIDSEHYADGSIDNAHIADDAIDSEHYADGSIDNAHIADDAIDSEHYADGSIDLAHMSVNSIDSDQYVDGSIDNEHLADDAVDSDELAAGSVDLAHMSSESVDEDNLHISNAGSNGQFLSKQSGNNGGLTWASAALAGIDDQSSSNDDQLTITDTAVVINEDSDDVDFRVESNGNTNMLTVNGGGDRVGIGADPDLGVGLHIKTGDTTASSVSGNADELIIENTGNVGMTIQSANDGVGNVYFGDVANGSIGRVSYDHSSNFMSFNTNASERMRILSDGNVGIGTTAPLGKLHIEYADSGASVSADADDLVLEEGSSGQGAGMTILNATNGEARIHFGDSGDNDIGRIAYNHGSDYMYFTTSASEAMRIDSSGNVLVGKTAANFGTEGFEFRPVEGLLAIQDGRYPLLVHRLTDDGEMIRFYAQSSLEGAISVSGNTVTYGAFCGSHWSRLADNSKPTILRGTVMESIATMVDWHQAVADVEEVLYVAEDREVIDGDKNAGDVKEKAYQVKENIALPDGKSVGDAVTFTSNGKEHTGVYAKEGNERLPMSKISDTEDSKAVYGVFMNWDDADDGLDGDVNDMNIAALGAFVVRIHKDETVAIGDYLQSKGDGTAKVQADDIMRASTIAKVTSTEKTHIHADDSYCVPCTLHCG